QIVEALAAASAGASLSSFKNIWSTRQIFPKLRPANSVEEQRKKISPQMKTLPKFIYAAFAILIFAMGAVTANSGPLTAPRPRPTPAPRPTPGPLPTLPPTFADIGSSYSNSKVPYAIDGQQILEDLGYPFADPGGVAYGDFNRDGIPDVVFAPADAIVIALGQPGGGYIDGTTQVISGEVPAPVNGRKILVADFNGDGWPDIFVADFGVDAPPFPGNHNWLLLS